MNSNIFSYRELNRKRHVLGPWGERNFAGLPREKERNLQISPCRGEQKLSSSPTKSVGKKTRHLFHLYLKKREREKDPRVSREKGGGGEGRQSSRCWEKGPIGLPLPLSRTKEKKKTQLPSSTNTERRGKGKDGPSSQRKKGTTLSIIPRENSVRHQGQNM